MQASPAASSVIMPSSVGTLRLPGWSSAPSCLLLHGLGMEGAFVVQVGLAMHRQDKMTAWGQREVEKEGACVWCGLGSQGWDAKVGPGLLWGSG